MFLQEIFQFICSCSLLREYNARSYKIAKALSPDETVCAKVWEVYISTHSVLKHLLKPEEYGPCSHVLCDKYDTCSRHLHNDPKTVKVLSYMQLGSDISILDILKHEKKSFLFTLDEMRFMNIFVRAHEGTEFPVLLFERYNQTFAVPLIRCSSDTRLCTSSLA